jgi:hypothetical protein
VALYFLTISNNFIIIGGDMIIFSTKYALTTGIDELEASPCGDNMMKCGRGHCLIGEGEDWHKTMKGAKEKAEQMRLKKIASLKKAIIRLETMNFN